MGLEYFPLQSAIPSSLGLEIFPKTDCFAAGVGVIPIAAADLAWGFLPPRPELHI